MSIRKTRKMRRGIKKRKITLNMSRKRKFRKIKKIKGGNNIGANCSDPNFSIYNTNLLKLFPYKGGEITDDAKLDINDRYKNNTADFY
jgi:hypothetical protein